MTSLSRSLLFAVLLAATCCQMTVAQISASASGFTDEQLAEIGLQYEDAINFGDVEFATSLFDVRGLGQRVADSLGLAGQQNADFTRGFIRSASLSQLMEQQINSVHSSLGYATFLRVHTINDIRGPLIRYDLGDDGFNYVMLIVDVAGRATPAIVDMYVGASGENLSQSIGALGQLIINPNPSLLSRLFGTEVVNTDLQSAFQTLGEQFRNTQYAAAYETIGSLPEEIRNHRLVAGLSVQIAALVDDAAYERELVRLAALHGDDPRTAFLLIDYHFLRGDWEAAMQSVETLEGIFGFDAAIGLFKTSIALEAGDAEAAAGYAQAALEVEPFDENSYWALLNASLATGNNADAVDALENLEIEFGYLFDTDVMATEDIYSAFLQSSEYASWAASRSAE